MEEVPILQVENISKAFPGVQALNRVSMDVQRGEVHALIGENGAGKSTLMSIIFGALRADDGVVRLDGRPAVISSPKHALDAGISMIFQEISLFPDLTVAENIFIDRLPRRGRATLVDWARLYGEAKELLADIGIVLQPRARVKDLSIGQQQLIEIARAWSMNSQLVIMDEPTSSLSGPETERLFEIIRLLKKRGIAVIYISHRLDEIFVIADRVSVLRDGMHVATRELKNTNKNELVALMVGREVSDMYARRKKQVGGEILRVEGFSREGFFQDISFSLKQGEILGLYGLVGSGRTELALSLFGYYGHDEGRVYVDGRPARIRSTLHAMEQGIGYLPEDRKEQSLIPIASVKDNITLANIRAYVRGLFVDKRREAASAREYVERLNIRTPSIFKKVMELSGGNQQKTVLSRILEKKPRIMILDEPTRGIDVGAKAEVHFMIEELAERGIAIILISSEMPEILAIADRILVMRNGHLGGEFLREEADQEKLLKAASL
ncbi:MAG: sugar ABC transporter ATP-binding protein [Spirochaetales bacterium]|nr:sugar ABC transporter ATP-binding protein [Spirochaetales bacterium]